MSTLTDKTISAMRANHNQLAAMVREFDEQDLARQSGSSQWDGAQVLAHLGSGAAIGLATLQTALAGLPVPDREFNVSVWDRWNAMSPQEKAKGILRGLPAMRTWTLRLAANCASPWRSCRFLPMLGCYRGCA